ncbi:MAG: hypothetical protein H6Q75_185 [Firmicutes bacterium]|nr:hypothetical protein [Bacillota bacterium]
MLRLNVQYVKPGMIISRNIYNSSGSLLLAKDSVLDESLIYRLSQLYIDAVYIKNPFCQVEPAEDVLHEKTRVDALRVTQKAFNEFRQTRKLEVTALLDIVNKVVEDIMSNKNAVIHLTDIRANDDYTFGHSINVCLLATMIGVKLKLKETQIKELALGALLHDVGKMLVPSELLGKTGKLTRDEWKIVKAHAEQGFEILRKDCAIPLVSAHTAYQHHESLDGKGYPRGITGNKVHYYAKITAIADIYDALTSERPYRQAMLPHEAYEIIMAERGVKLDAELVDVFLENVALYPIGTVVRLNTGEIGVVVKVYSNLKSRPVLQMLVNAAGERLTGENQNMDLLQELTCFIDKVYKPEEVALQKWD